MSLCIYCLYKYLLSKVTCILCTWHLNNYFCLLVANLHRIFNILIVKMYQISRSLWMVFHAPRHSHVLLVVAIVHYLMAVTTPEMSLLNAVSIFCDSQLTFCEYCGGGSTK